MDKKQTCVRTQDAVKSVPIPVQYKNVLSKYIPRVLSKFTKYKLTQKLLLLLGCKSKLILALILLAI